MADVTFTVDGKKITAPAGTLLIEVSLQDRGSIEVPRLLLLSSASRSAARAGCAWSARRRSVNSRPHALRPSPKARSSIRRSTRSYRRARRPSRYCWATIHWTARSVMPAANANCKDMTLLSTGRGVALYRGQAAPRRAAVVAGGLLRPAPLHSLLSLRARLRRRNGCLGAWRAKSRRHQRDRSQWRRPPRLRRVRHVHRYLPGRRADLRHLSLQDAPLGDEPCRHRLHPLRRRLQDHARRASRR